MIFFNSPVGDENLIENHPQRPIVDLPNDHEDLISNLVKILLELYTDGAGISTQCICRIGSKILGNPCNSEWLESIFHKYPELESIVKGNILHIFYKQTGHVITVGNVDYFQTLV